MMELLGFFGAGGAGRAPLGLKASSVLSETRP